MDDEHGIDVVCFFGGNQDPEHQITIQPDGVHADDGEGHMLHISPKIDLYSAEKREQKQVKEEGRVRDDAFGDLVIGEGRVIDEIHIGKHPDMGDVLCV